MRFLFTNQRQMNTVSLRRNFVGYANFEFGAVLKRALYYCLEQEFFVTESIRWEY